MACRHTVEQITDFREGALPFWKTMLMRFHLRVCPHCSEFSRQLETTSRAVKSLEPEKPPAGVRDHLLDEFRKRDGRS